METEEMHQRFDATTVESVIEHMNSDHDDACLIMVRLLGDQPDAVKALMTDIDASGMSFTVFAEHHVNPETLDDEPGAAFTDTQVLQTACAAPESVRINFPKPLRDSSQIRGMLVAMTKQARAREK